MATPFSRIIRSLEDDNFYFSLLGLFIAITLAIFWGYWFFSAKIVSYETSQYLQLTDEKRMIRQFPSNGPLRVQEISRRFLKAYFSPLTLRKIHPGQKAWVRLKEKYGQLIDPLPAIVMQVLPARESQPGYAVLQLDLDPSIDRLVESGVGGEAQIEVAQQTPAQLVLHTAGFLKKTSSISTSPQ